MSRLARFQKKPKVIEFEVEDEKGNKIKEKLTVKPFKTTDIELMMDIADMANAEKRMDAAHAMIKKVLKQNIPDFTDEEYTKMDYAFADAILDAIMEVNSAGQELSDTKKKFLAEMKAKQEASKKTAKEEAQDLTKKIIPGAPKK